MKYHRSYRGTRPRKDRGGTASVVGTLLALLALGGLFAFTVAKFRSPAMPEVVPGPDAPSPSLLLPPPNPDPEGIRGEERIDLSTLRGDTASGEATRRLEGGVFFHTVKATLPTIDRGAYAYEGWLVRPVPFEYFSTGEMVTNDLGEFVLGFEGDPRGDYEGFVQVIVTLERKDGDPDPGEHVLGGEF